MTLRRRMALALIAPLAFGLTGAVLLSTAPPHEEVSVGRGGTSPVQPAVPGSVRYLIEQHGCWTGEAPPDVEIPGHAVVTWPGDIAPTYGGDRAVAAALEHVFEGRHPGLEVHAFCR